MNNNPVKIVLIDEIPESLNKYYSGTHWNKRATEAQRQQLIVRAEIDPNMQPFTVPVSITFNIFYPDMRIRDIDNAMVKMYIDGLKPHLITDDDYRYVRSITKNYFHDKRFPRTEILIRPFDRLGVDIKL